MKQKALLTTVERKQTLMRKSGLTLIVTSTVSALGGPKFREQRWSFAEEEESSGTEETAETKEYVPDQDMEVDDDKSLEGVGIVQSAVTN